MIRKLFALFSIIVITTLLSFNVTINIVNKIERQIKLQREWEEEHRSRLLNDVSYAYNQQLSEDPILQKEVQELTSDESIRKRFYQYEGWLENFAEECYRKLKGGVFSCTDKKGVMFVQTEAQGSLGIVLPDDDKYVVDFIDKAIESGFVFRYWMLTIIKPSSIEEWQKNDSITQLKITIYKDDELKVSYVYSPFVEIDLSRDETWLQDCIDIEQNMKVIRINSHWYYECLRTKEW